MRPTSVTRIDPDRLIRVYPSPLVTSDAVPLWEATAEWGGDVVFHATGTTVAMAMGRLAEQLAQELRERTR